MDVRNENLGQQQAQWGMDHVRARLAAVAEEDGDGASAPKPEALDLDDPALAHPQLQRLIEAFGLNAFEAQVLLLALAVEVSPELAELAAECHGREDFPFATFRLAVSLFPGSDWRALTPAGPLRQWDLVEIEPTPGLLDGRLTLSEFTLHWLCGAPTRMRPLSDMLTAVRGRDDPELPASHAAIAERIALALAGARPSTDEPLVIELVCPEPADGLAIALAVGERLKRPLDRLRADAALLPAQARAGLIRMIAREQRLRPGLLLLEVAERLPPPEEPPALARFLAEAPAAVIVCSPARIVPPGAPWMAFEVAPPTRAEQDGLWRARLGDDYEAMADMLARFNMRRGAIEAALRSFEVARRADGDETPRAQLGEACRAQLRGPLDAFALRMEARARLEDLVLPPPQQAQLRSIALDVRNQPKALEIWTAGGRSTRGLGMCALFTGPSGAGKTTAAEALAGLLDLDLYRVDLSAIVSKYIGETEKQLDRLFDAAEGGGSLLLFDESDALFGKRTEVRDSHDRYANQEISFLLQKLETYRGLAVLTSNMPDALDTAFLRRFRYVIEFPAPGPAEREEIWRRVFGPATPVSDLDPARLAKLNLTGGHIRNVALQSLFMATAEGGPVTMELIYRAVRQEYRKLHRTPTEEELEG